MKEMPVSYKLRIPTIDKLLKEHNKKHVQIVSIDNTEEDKIILRKLDDFLVKEIDSVDSIVCEVLEYLKARGVDVSEYI